MKAERVEPHNGGARPMRWGRWARATLVGAALTSCAVGYSPPPDVESVVEIPAEYGALFEGSSQETSLCEAFDDPTLASLLETSLGDNLNLHAAWARLEQGESAVRLAHSGVFPSVNLELSAGRARRSNGFGVAESNSFGASLPAAYEVDLWGRVSSSENAAELDHAALRLDVETVATSLAAQVTETWLDVVHQRALLRLIDEQHDTNDTFRSLILIRLGHGQASAPDILQQDQRLEALEAQRTLVEARLATSDYRLAVLLGMPPRAEGLSGDRADLPALPSPPGLGVPADLLNRRPDVRAAGLRLASANYRVAAAVAARLPGVRLTGALSLSATSPAELLDNLLWSVLGSITGPLFDGGRTQAEIDRNRALVRERLAQYGQSLLTAMEEVEGALVLERQQLAYLDELGQQLETSHASLDVERDRYLNGVTDYLRVLTALQNVQQVEQSQLNARRQLLTYRVQLCRAVGGEWTTGLAPPARSEQTSSEQTQ